MYIFIITLFLLAHIYLCYPFIIYILSLASRNKNLSDEEFIPSVSVLIAAYNEEKTIENTLARLADSNYPKDKIEILIGSDCSIDRTVETIERFKNKSRIKIHVYDFKVRRGKPFVINDLASHAKGKIFVFCDANTIYEKDAIRMMVRHFSDYNIGGVSGKLLLVEKEDGAKGIKEEKFYWDLESRLKEFEGKLGVLIGANGGIYAVRKNCFDGIPVDRPIMDDLYISLRVLQKGKKFIYERKAKAFEYIAPSLQAEYHRKVRNNSICLSTLMKLRNLLLPKYGLIAYCLWSHKVTRWHTPLLLIILYLSNIFLLSDLLFQKIFIIQNIILLYSAAGIFLINRLKRFRVLLMPSYFLVTVYAMFIGWLKFVFNKQTIFWQSTPR